LTAAFEGRLPLPGCHERPEESQIESGEHQDDVIDAVGLVHAMIPRIQALLLPIKTLVLSGH
jgi:hypothetical protein